MCKQLHVIRKHRLMVFFHASYHLFSMTGNQLSLATDVGTLDQKIVLKLFDLASARPAVTLGLWSIMSSLRGNFNVPLLHNFIKWFVDNDVAHRN